MIEYLLGLATLPALGLVWLILALTFLPNATTDFTCHGCSWELHSRIPVVQWAWKLAHWAVKAHRVEHVRRVREDLIKYGYSKRIVMAFEKRHRRAMNKIIREGETND